MKICKNRYLRAFILSVIISALINACKTPGEFQRPASIELPGNDDITDTSFIRDLSGNQFFRDTYLQHLIDTALERNRDAQIAIQRIAVARADYQATGGALFPSVSGIATAGVNRFSTNAFNRPNQNKTIGADVFTGFQSSWEIDIWNKFKNRRRASFLRLLSTRQGLLLLRTNLIAEVAQRYYSLLTLDSIQAILVRNIKLQNEALRVIVIQKEGGRATELAVQQFKAQLLNTQTLHVDYRQQILEKENEINELLGRLPQPIVRSPDVADTFYKVATSGIPAEWLLNRPDVQQAELSLQALEADIKVARTAFLPSLTISPYVGLNATNPVKLLDPGSIVFGIVGGVTSPFFNRIVIQSNYNRSISTAREAFITYQKIINTSYTEAFNNINLTNTLKEMYYLKEQQTKTLQDAVSTSQDLYLAGYASYLEVILAQGSVLQSELELITIKNRMYESQINLFRILGGGWR